MKNQLALPVRNKIMDGPGNPRTPVDKVAVRVIGKGVAYAANTTVDTPESKNCFKIKTHPNPESDLAGHKFGRFTVIGRTLCAPLQQMRTADG